MSDSITTIKNSRDEKGEAAHSTQAKIIADHYNKIEEKGIVARFKSPIFYLRNFNNWIKSVQINETINDIRKNQRDESVVVLDICSGKGGDLVKYQHCNITHLVCADIANVSIDQCQDRYNTMKNRARSRTLYSAEFIVADCTRDTLSTKYLNRSIVFDLVSCQFGFHYCFESLSQAECMLQNVTECLKEGGYFIGTIPNAYDIISRCKKANTNKFGNSKFSVELLFDPDQDGYPIFGAKYNFQLEGVVNCPEFLVNFKVLLKLAKKYNLELLYKKSFADYFNEHKSKYKYLLDKINCFETFPSKYNQSLLSEECDYEHARKYLKNLDKYVGTMSKSEWEALTIYEVFAFRKKKST